jgi:NAD(P)H-flavin reductase
VVCDALTSEGNGGADAFTTPGQYVQVKCEGQVSFLAIRSAPDPRPEFSFLLKSSPSTAPLFLSPPPPVSLSQPLGAGFPVEDISGFRYDFPLTKVVLCALGTGIAPVASLLDSDALRLSRKSPSGRSAVLYYGARGPAERLLGEEVFAKWERELELTVKFVYSKDGNGYVQDVLEREKGEVFDVPRNTGVVCAGTKGMMERVKEIAEGCGVLEGRVVSNF